MLEDGQIVKTNVTDAGTGKTVATEFFAELGENEMLLIFEQGTGFRTWFSGLSGSAPEKAFLTDAAKFAETKFIIKDMAGINIPAAE